MEKKFITTSIAYINAEPHIGFLLELLSADVLTRYARLIGENVFFLTGTDEHGQKIEQAAKAAGLEPKQFADNVAEKFRALGKDFNISFDYFVRTTDEQHIEFVTNAWKKLEKAGVLEKRSYAGFYCVGCEAFKTEREIENGKCPIHEKEVEKIEEENYFLIIDKEKKNQIRAWLPAIYPVGRRNEVESILDSNYGEVSVSRPKDKLSWGIPVPGDENQVMYVWVDALLNYISAIEASNRSISEIWPADIQIIGKDILKFHAIIWPAILISLGYDLPNQLLVHGFVSVDGKKMSKSLGNVITPAQLVEKYGVEASRYLILRKLNYYYDSNFSWYDFNTLYSGELSNGLGNLVARTIGLLGKHPDSKSIVETKLAQARPEEYLEKSALKNSPDSAPDFSKELNDINDLINAADGWISENKPWTWAEPTEENLTELFEKSNLVEISYRLEPFLPETAQKIRAQLKELKSEILFPRLG